MARADQIHQVATGDVFGLLRSRLGGLTALEADARRCEVGPNCLQPPSRWRWLKGLIKHFVNFFSILLDIAAIVCFVADAIQPGEGMRLLGWALLGVSVLNALFAFAQEMRAERAMEELRKFLPQGVRGRRDGAEREVPAEDLVPGDVLLVAEGDRIAADARLVETEDLLVNNAPLTGESRSQPLKTAPAKGRLIESPNVAFAGCSVLRGNGAAVVFATGHRTELGKIAALSRDVRRPLSALQRETNRMIRVLTVIAVAMGILFFAYGNVLIWRSHMVLHETRRERKPPCHSSDTPASAPSVRASMSSSTVLLTATKYSRKSTAVPPRAVRASKHALSMSGKWMYWW